MKPRRMHRRCVSVPRNPTVDIAEGRDHTFDAFAALKADITR